MVNQISVAIQFLLHNPSRIKYFTTFSSLKITSLLGCINTPTYFKKVHIRPKIKNKLHPVDASLLSASILAKNLQNLRVHHKHSICQKLAHQWKRQKLHQQSWPPSATNCNHLSLNLMMIHCFSHNEHSVFDIHHCWHYLPICTV